MPGEVNGSKTGWGDEILQSGWSGNATVLISGGMDSPIREMEMIGYMRYVR